MVVTLKMLFFLPFFRIEFTFYVPLCVRHEQCFAYHLNQDWSLNNGAAVKWKSKSISMSRQRAMNVKVLSAHALVNTKYALRPLPLLFLNDIIHINGNYSLNNSKNFFFFFCSLTDNNNVFVCIFNRWIWIWACVLHFWCTLFVDSLFISFPAFELSTGVVVDWWFNSSTEM